MADDFFSLSMLMKKFHKTHERCVWHNDTYLIGHLTSFWQVLMMVDLVSVGQVERPCCDCFSANFLYKIVTTGGTANFIIIVMNNTFWAVREIKSQACKPWSYASSKLYWLSQLLVKLAWGEDSHAHSLGHRPVQTAGWGPEVNTSVLAALASTSA